MECKCKGKCLRCNIYKANENSFFCKNCSGFCFICLYKPSIKGIFCNTCNDLCIKCMGKRQDNVYCKYCRWTCFTCQTKGRTNFTRSCSDCVKIILSMHRLNHSSVTGQYFPAINESIRLRLSNECVKNCISKPSAFCYTCRLDTIKCFNCHDNFIKQIESGLFSEVI